MKKSKIAIAMALLITSAFVVAQARVELEARLTGAGKGKVTWKTRDQRGQLQAELEGEGERLAPNTPYVVTVGSHAPIHVMTNSFGTYRFNQRFTTASRPAIRVGDKVVVTSATAAVVQSGVFQIRR